MRYYKVLDKDGCAYHGGSGKYYLPTGNRPGKWMPKIRNIVECERGYHVCQRKHLIKWVGETIWIAEGRGKKIVIKDKVVFEQVRLLSRLNRWNEKTARLFAADCAERVLLIYERKHPNNDRPRKAIESSRLYALGKTTINVLTAASDAASAAAWAAASAAAWAAASAAASDAARAAASDAARAAASDAASAAASDAARTAASDAARKWQTERLFKYLEGKYD